VRFRRVWWPKFTTCKQPWSEIKKQRDEKDLLFLVAHFRVALQQASAGRNQRAPDWERQLAEKDRLLAEKDRQLGEKDRMLAAQVILGAV
jgi:hypothetical protein